MEQKKKENERKKKYRTIKQESNTAVFTRIFGLLVREISRVRGRTKIRCALSFFLSFLFFFPSGFFCLSSMLVTRIDGEAKSRLLFFYSSKISELELRQYVKLFSS
jgi:hypothetical protein